MIIYYKNNNVSILFNFLVAEGVKICVVDQTDIGHLTTTEQWCQDLYKNGWCSPPCKLVDKEEGNE